MEGKRITTNCPHCGREFWYYRSWPRKYCSRKCSGANNAKNFGKFYRPESRVALKCEQCGQDFTRNAFEVTKTEHHFCSRKCFGQWLALDQKGKPRPEVTGEKPHLQKRIAKKCPICKAAFQVKQSSASRRRFCSKVCMAKHQQTLVGPMVHNWKGGPLPYYGPNWLQQRRNARRRDNYTCRKCGKSEQALGRQLDVHHIKSFRSIGAKNYRTANKLTNLVSLCNACHKYVEHHGWP